MTPDTNDLASVLAAVISSNLTEDEILYRTGVVADDVQPAVRHLIQREIIRDVGGGLYHASQSRCAGSCMRDGGEIRGKEVVIDPRTFRWTCADCWDGRDGTTAPRDDNPDLDEQ